MASVSAWANDFGNNQYIFSELIGYTNRGDILIILSTSEGNLKQKQSMNLIKLSKIAKQNKIFLISLLGKGGGALKKSSDIFILLNQILQVLFKKFKKCFFIQYVI